MHETARRLEAPTVGDDLADVIPLPSSEVQSFYQRNTGALPKIGHRSSDLHRRASLPSPVNDDSTGFLRRIKGLLAGS